MHLHAFFSLKIKGNIAVVQGIICKIFFYYVLFVPGTNHKIIYSIMGVNLHDMPEYRIAANFHHGLWPHLGFLADARTKPACQYNNFHSVLFLAAKITDYIHCILFLLLPAKFSHTALPFPLHIVCRPWQWSFPA